MCTLEFLIIVIQFHQPECIDETKTWACIDSGVLKKDQCGRGVLVQSVMVHQGMILCHIAIGVHPFP